MEINLCIPTLNRFDLLIKCVESALLGRLRPTKIYIMDNGGICDALPEYNVPVEVINLGSNMGVGRSWNYFLCKADDYIIISNDDIIFLPDTIEKMVGCANKYKKEIFFSPQGMRDWNWALFLQRKRSLAEIGFYDDFFLPAYYEDSDYRYRMKLKGYEPFIVPNCYYIHNNEGGSTAKALKETGEHINNGDKLEEYFMLKWGGPRYEEVYKTPFNLTSKRAPGK